MTKCVCGAVKKVLCGLDFVSPVVPLAIRFYVGWVFFHSGLLKIQSWGQTLNLFENIYKVPLLPFKLAAYMATATELTAPVLLALGLGARFGALALIIMTLVIHFTFEMDMDHSYWVLLLGIIFVQGPGKLSIDHVIRRRCLGDCSMAACQAKPEKQ
jgi:putative oxidoreductase